MIHMTVLKISLFTLVMICIYYITVVQKLVWISWYNTLKYTILFICGVYIFRNLPLIKKNLDHKLTGALAIFSMCAIYSAINNVENIKNRNVILVTIVLLLSIWEFYMMLACAKGKGKTKNVVHLYKNLTAITIAVTDIGVLFVPTIDNGNYLIGTKFTVTYLHILLVALYLASNKANQKKNNRVVLTLLITLSVLISLKVECVTGIVGLLIYIVCYLNKEQFSKLFLSARAFIASILVVDSFAVAYEMVLNNVYVQNIISNIFHRSLTLTGRAYVYQKLPIILETNLIWGNGCGSAYEIMQRYTPYADAQNGVAQWIIQVGIVGTIALFGALALCFRNFQKSLTNQGEVEIAILVFVFIVLSSIEITFDTMFIVLVLLVGYLKLENSCMRKS